MSATLQTDVLIAGAGPVGLSLAMDLAWRGLKVTVLEIRERGEPPNVKCNHVAARTMEAFRRIGLVDKVRNAGLPEDFPHDISYRTTTVGIELSRIPIPCRRDRYTATGGPDTWWPTPELPHRINQLFLEPILFEHAWSMPGITILNRTRLDDFTQDAQGVSATATDLRSGATIQLKASYLVGCDGGRSEVRTKIGAKLEGTAVVQRVQSSYIRAPSLIKLLSGKPAWSLFSLNPRRSGNIFAIDGKETWLVHNHLRDDEPDFDSVDRDQAIRDMIGVGPEFEYEIISKEDWYGRRLVANKFRQGRVFICGDAAHLWVPYAGYGMNAGIADAMSLSWLLAAQLQGWGDPDILDAHELERLPITEQVSHFAMNHSIAMYKQRNTVPANIEEPGPEGDAARARLGQEAYDLNVQQYCCAGLNFGYYYPDSPLIAYDGEAQPAYSMGDFTPSSVPGCRTPHFWLADGRSLYDAMGPGYTLLRFDPAVDVAPLQAAAASRKLPLLVLDVVASEVPDACRHKLLLSRPDQHVAWRGDALPADVLGLVDQLRGARRAEMRLAA
jgi:2-polyprenyl-6-methoxyphenol hydroxylase-like FAD-dependent oxidoreductase